RVTPASRSIDSPSSESTLCCPCLVLARARLDRCRASHIDSSACVSVLRQPAQPALIYSSLLSGFASAFIHSSTACPCKAFSTRLHRHVPSPYPLSVTLAVTCVPSC
ncbi:hypothetical protein JMJ77_0012476, partial [Colletotrichum scovillei]